MKLSVILGIALIVTFAFWIYSDKDTAYRINKAYDDGYKDAMSGVYNRAEKLLK